MSGWDDCAQLACLGLGASVGLAGKQHMQRSSVCNQLNACVALSPVMAAADQITMRAKLLSTTWAFAMC